LTEPACGNCTRRLLVKHARPLVLACILTAPPCLLFVATLGRLLGLAPADVAGLVPATTTTGLALAMGEGSEKKLNVSFAVLGWDPSLSVFRNREGAVCVCVVRLTI
jgi:hypothetical protein